MPDYAGNNLLSAREISFAIGSQTFRDRVDTSDTNDYYRISLSGRSSLNLAINDLSANANVQLLDSYGNTLQTSSNSAGISESINQVLNAGIYYIRVYQSGSGADTDYTLNLGLQNGFKTDIFWRDYSSGANATWFMGGTNNTSITGSTYLTSVATNWRIEGIADFNGDSRPDLLWRDYSSGANAVWFMGGTNNATITSASYLTSVATNWHIDGIADFNGDSRPDLLWRDYSSGANAVWFMGGTNNATITSASYLTSVATNWRIEGTADFNGDSRPDLLWRDYSSGANAVWFMGGTNNTSMIAASYLASAATNWRIEGTADFNGDSRPDLLWRDYSSGTNAVWFMGGTNNTSMIAASYLTSVPTNWQALPYTRYEEPTTIDLAGDTTNTAFNLGTLIGNGVFSDRLDSTDPNDYYQFILSSASNINLVLNGLSANADLQLLGSNGAVIQGSYNSSSSAESINAILGAGTYYIRVYQSSGSTSYSLNLSATTPQIYRYNFTYSYGNGDSYQGYGYTADASYYSGKYLYDSAVNETGNSGYYYISSVSSGYSTSYYNQVYVSSYYNSETGTSYSPFSGYGSSGLGSECGYVTSGDNNTYYGSKYYEADFGYQSFTFKYSYGSGKDYYTGYGYTDYGKYTSSQYLYDTSINETGTYGFYQITSITNYASGTASLNTIYVSSYYNSENNTSYTPYSGYSNSGLGNEYGYLTSAQTTTNDYFGRRYYEADFAGWFSQNVMDYGLQLKGDSLFADGKIDRNDIVALFRDAEDGGIIDSTELTDLRKVVSSYSTLRMDDYVRVLTNKVVNSNTANAWYTGGGTRVSLGNLYAGSSSGQMETLISKWFLGADRAATSYQYSYASGSLFQNGASYQDVFQGVVGDCYFLAGLAETAFRSSSTIQSMFIDNGDNTYTVRFYNNGVADYVTVDRYLPMDTSGRFVYAHQSASSWGYYSDASNELWVALAEKAYAQINESGWLDGPASGQYFNSYQSIESGYGGGAITDITGRSTTYDTLDISDFTAVVDAFNQARWVYFSSKGAGQVASNIVNDHGYVLVDYSSSTQKFKLFNPWGINGGNDSNWNLKPGYVDLTISELVSSFLGWTKTTT